MSIDTTGLAGLLVKSTHNMAASGDPATALDRYVLDSAESDGRIAVVEHVLAPGVLAAPLRRHSREDEYSFVLSGRLGVVQDDELRPHSAAGRATRAAVLSPTGHP